MRAASAAAKNEAMVTIWADDDTPHQRVIDVLNACASAKIKNVSFAATGGATLESRVQRVEIEKGRAVLGLHDGARLSADVIVVAEMRDLDTIRIALTAAETGHLVLSTLHTPDAPQTRRRPERSDNT